MITLSEAVKKSRKSKQYLLSLIGRGFVTYAVMHSPIGDIYIVEYDDIVYHIKQVLLRKQGTLAINNAKLTKALKNNNVPQDAIDAMFASQAMHNAIKIRKAHNG